jgi:broad specificity phosphatase PhoE
MPQAGVHWKQMRILEHYRHSWRAPDGVHVTQEGVELARRVGERLGPFDKVITSEIPRAIETAVAMGYAVNAVEPLLSSLLDADTEVDWTAGCAAFAEVYKRGGRLTRAAEAHAGMLRRHVRALPSDGRLLAVSHGGVIELGVVGLLPNYDYAAWGPSCERCEGVRLYFDDESCVRAELLRLTNLLTFP